MTCVIDSGSYTGSSYSRPRQKFEVGSPDQTLRFPRDPRQSARSRSPPPDPSSRQAKEDRKRPAPQALHSDFQDQNHPEPPSASTHRNENPLPESGSLIAAKGGSPAIPSTHEKSHDSSPPLRSSPPSPLQREVDLAADKEFD